MTILWKIAASAFLTLVAALVMGLVDELEDMSALVVIISLVILIVCGFMGIWSQ